MMKARKIVLLSFLFFLITGGILRGQELNLDININTPTLKTADPKVFKTLETAMEEFINNTIWTEDSFEPIERIEGSIQINIKDDLSSNTFIADIYISTSRPIYNSNYYSQLINYVDRDVHFSYDEYGPLYNNKNSFSDNLSAILSYYAYIIIGFDYDSFSPLGGEIYFQLAQNIVSSIPPSVSGKDKAWVSIGSTRNRYWLVENLLNGRVRSYRHAYYDYHRRGLDEMSNDPSLSRAKILSAIKAMGEVNRTFPNSMILKMFSDSKRQEILEIFKEGPSAEKKRVYDVMTAIDPAQSSELSDLRS